MAKPLYCTDCQAVSKPYRRTRGSLLGELLAWCAGLLAPLVIGVFGWLLLGAAFVYSLWRQLSGRIVECRNCGGQALIPLDSPRAERELDALDARQPAERSADLAPRPPRRQAPRAAEFVHEIPATSGGRYRLIAPRELDRATAQATIARAIESGTARPPAAGQVVTLRAH